MTRKQMISAMAKKTEREEKHVMEMYRNHKKESIKRVYLIVCGGAANEG